jgi:hypothetical protein
MAVRALAWMFHYSTPIIQKNTTPTKIVNPNKNNNVSIMMIYTPCNLVLIFHQLE